MKVYNKLVRDKIPEIMLADGATPVTHILNDDDYLTELIKKLAEEMAEFEADHSLEELADIAEVVHALTTVIGETPESLEAKRVQKAGKRGGFQKRIFLERAD